MTQTPTDPKIGDKLPDGTIYAGVSSKTGDQLFVIDPDKVGGDPRAGTLMTFNDTQEALRNLAEHGHHFRLPTKEEILTGQFNKRADERTPEWTSGKTMGEILDEGKTYTGKPVLIPTRPPKA